MINESYDPEYAARVYAMLVSAMVEAKARIDADNLGPPLQEIVQHAREMYDLLREQIEAAPLDARDSAATICEAIETNMRQLDELVRGDGSPAPP